VNPGQQDGDIALSFQENGYYLARATFSGQLLDAMETAFDRIVDQLQRSGEDINARWQGSEVDRLDGGTSEIIHTHNVQRYSATWLGAFQHPDFLDIAEQFLGPDIVLHHSKLFQKPPRHGAPFPMHQDWGYFPTAKDSMIAAIIFLSDADDASGGVRVYPGSHKLGRMEDTLGMEVRELGIAPSRELQKYPLEKASPINAKRGDVLFFHYFTLHGSTPNTSDQTRKTVLVQMHSGDDMVIDHKIDHSHDPLTLRGWNHHMTRQKARRQ
jgi:ectoine hydroxylase-related dioxygenase (phytanoyl-CoA dioxygenase family)